MVYEKATRRMGFHFSFLLHYYFVIQLKARLPQRARISSIGLLEEEADNSASQRVRQPVRVVFQFLIAFVRARRQPATQSVYEGY